MITVVIYYPVTKVYKNVKAHPTIVSNMGFLNISFTAENGDDIEVFGIPFTVTRS